MKITHEEGNFDAWVCVCGNEPQENGFYPCDTLGNEVEPDQFWNGRLYLCAQCKRIINQRTLQVWGRLSRKGNVYNA